MMIAKYFTVPLLVDCSKVNIVNRDDDHNGNNNVLVFPRSPAEELRIIRRMLRRSPIKRRSALAMLKRQVEEGTYILDPSAIAAAILKQVNREHKKD